MEKRPISTTLRSMNVGDVELFPLTQYNSLRSTKYNTMLVERAEGMDWEIVPDMAAKHIRVTRIA